MNAEKLLLYLKKCIEKNFDKFEAITLNIGNPTELQNNVSIIIMERIGDDTIPKFRIDVKDLEALRNKKYGKNKSRS